MRVCLVQSPAPGHWASGGVAGIGFRRPGFGASCKSLFTDSVSPFPKCKWRPLPDWSTVTMSVVEQRWSLSYVHFSIFFFWVTFSIFPFCFPLLFGPKWVTVYICTLTEHFFRSKSSIITPSSTPLPPPVEAAALLSLCRQPAETPLWEQITLY